MSTTATSTLRTVSLAASGAYALLVDDDECCLAGMRALVERAGLRPVTARCGGEALVYCDTRRPDLVVTDLSMPQIDGLVFTRWLKARYPTTPVILVSGQDLSDPWLVRQFAPFAAVFPKPVDPEALLTTVAKLVSAGRNAP